MFGLLESVGETRDADAGQILAESPPGAASRNVYDPPGRLDVQTDTDDLRNKPAEYNHTQQTDKAVYTTLLDEATINSLADGGDDNTHTIDDTFGHDEIAQRVHGTDEAGQPIDETHVFGHDGHGSVRVLYDLAGTVEHIAQAFTFAAYGELLAVHGPDAVAVPGTARLTSLGYSGEHFDTRAQQQYLRARWYDPASGRFNRLDPFAGNMQDPQSLHKYAYVHGDPVQGVDPTGKFNVVSTLGSIGNALALGMARLSSAATSARLLNARATLVANAYTLALFDNSLSAANFSPSGWVVSIGLGAATFGFAGGGGISIYGLNGAYYLQPFTEWGLAPLSSAKRHQLGGGPLVTGGFTFGLRGASDLQGGGTTATFPVAGLNYAKHFMSYRKDAIAQFFNILSRMTLRARMWNRSPGVFQVMASDDLRSSALLMGTRTFSWSATRYRGYNAIKFTSLERLIDEINQQANLADVSENLGVAIREIDRLSDEVSG